MEDILKQLYHGELDPSAGIILENEDSRYYQQLKTKITEQQEYFKNKMSDVEFKKLEEITMSMQTINNMFKYAGFSQGLKLGISLMLDIFW